ncbi:hypothetical protein BGZ63DRAFT_236496 [Mariannaea sp. PMI_226]|nr:hypothetical protein BGZ63DRAFT_236496 [Mariannaea sp. PMI_226]
MASSSRLPESNTTDTNVIDDSPVIPPDEPSLDSFHDYYNPDSGQGTMSTRHPTPSFARPVCLGASDSDTACDNTEAAGGGNWYIRLTPIEQRAPRRDIRIAMILSFTRLVAHGDIQLGEVHKQVAEAFSQALQHWPWLTGRFLPCIEDSSQVMLSYSRRQEQAHVAERIEKGNVNDDLDPERNTSCQMDLAKVRKSLFVCKHDSQGSGEETFPVTVKTSIIDNALVLGFSFSQRMFDRYSIQNFFCKFLEATNGHSFQQERVAVGRWIPGVQDGEANLDLLPCYDWTDNDIQGATPPDQLRQGVVALCPVGVNDLRKCVCDVIEHDEMDGVVLTEDCIFALFWVLIMRARFEEGRITGRDTCRARLVIPGFGHIRFPFKDVDYSGNSTAAVIAALSSTELILASSPSDTEDELPERVQHEDIALAALTIRDALRNFSSKTLSHLGAAKRDIHPVFEKRAHIRATKRQTDTLVFEDWTCYGTGRGAGLAYVRKPCPWYFPCCDDVEEGTVILLPRRSDCFSKEKWHIYVCLTQRDWERLTQDLRGENWLQPEII